jgi:hypothetical protein
MKRYLITGLVLVWFHAIENGGRRSMLVLRHEQKVNANMTAESLQGIGKFLLCCHL